MGPKAKIGSCHRGLRALLKEYLTGGGCALEVGPGYLPLLPLEGPSYFVEVNKLAVWELGKGGGKVVVGSAQKLPYRSGVFDLVCAFDVLEHFGAY